MRHAIAGVALLLLFALHIGAEEKEQQPPPETAAQTAASEIGKAVQEFRIQSEALGLRPGAVKRRQSSGGPKPEWHGRLYHNLRNDVFDAIPHEIVQNGGDKRALRRNQYGFNVTGPVVIPKLYNGGRRTFFSFSYEGMRETIGRSSLATIATPAERAGDWSRTVDQAGQPLPVYDPKTTRRNPAFDPARPVSRDNLEYVRDPFPAARIPETRLDPVARRALDFYPTPNSERGPFFRNNFFLVSPETNNADGLITKIDHAVRDRHQFSLNLSLSDGFSGASRQIDSVANPGPVDNESRSRSATLNHVFTLSPRTINNASFSVSSTRAASAYEEADYGGLLGLNGVDAGAFPLFRFQNYLRMGRSYPIYRNARHVYSVGNSFSHREGRHQLRLNADYSHQQVNTFWPRYPAGTFEFSANPTGLPGIVNTGHEFASFLLGQADFAERTTVLGPSYFRQGQFSLTVADNYEITPGLQLNLQSRLAWRRPRVEKYDRQSTIDLSAVNPAAGREGALVFPRSGSAGRSFQPLSFVAEPSLSVSWSPGNNPKTVARLSYSRLHTEWPLYFGQWATQGFTGADAFISPNPQIEPAARLESGLPGADYPLPDLRPEAANDTVAHLMSREHRLPTYDYLSASLERQLPHSLVVRLTGGRSHGKNVLNGNGSTDLNAIPMAALGYRDALNDEAFNRAMRPFPQFRSFDVYDTFPLGWYNYDYFYTTVEKRGSTGLTLSGQYRFSKQMDDYSGGVQDFYNRRNERSLYAGHRPHRFTMSYSYDLPFEKLALMHWARGVMDGWTVSGSTRLYSGQPIRFTPAFNNTGRVIRNLRVNVVPGENPEVANQGPDLWFNPFAFDQPADFTAGNLSRTHPTLLNPPFQDHDLSLRKRISLTTERTVEFTAVGLNFLNTANWNEPDAVIGPLSAPNVNAGRIIGSRGGRIIQVGLRFSF